MISEYRDKSEEEIMDELCREGFRNIFSHTDPPGAFYPDHTHSNETCHVVTDGEITVTSSGSTRIFKKGERFDVLAGEMHSANVGPEGCTYILGER